MSFRLRLVPIALVCALFVPALAGNGDPPASADVGTSWVKLRVAATTSGECQWTWFVTAAPVKSDQTDDPAAESGHAGVGTTDAYAHAIADGMPIWGYAWAYDDRAEGAARAATSSVSNGRAGVVASRLPEDCTPEITADWSPRFRLRAHARKGAAAAGAGGLLFGRIAQLNMTVSAGLDVHLQSAPRVLDTSNTSTSVTIAGVTHTVSRIAALGSSSSDWTAMGSARGRAGVSMATVEHAGSSWTSASADSTEDGTTSESEAFLWDAVPSLELHATCLEPCSGSRTIRY